MTSRDRFLKPSRLIPGEALELLQKLERPLVQRACTFGSFGFGVTTEFRGVSRSAEMDNLVVGERDTQPIRTIDVRDGAAQGMEDACDGGLIRCPGAAIEPGQNRATFFGGEILQAIARGEARGQAGEEC